MPGIERAPLPRKVTDDTPDPFIIEKINRERARKEQERRDRQDENDRHAPNPINPNDMPDDPEADNKWRRDRGLPPRPRREDDKTEETIVPPDFPNDEDTGEAKIDYRL